jgi:hypothetical protein
MRTKSSQNRTGQACWGVSMLNGAWHDAAADRTERKAAVVLTVMIGSSSGIDYRDESRRNKAPVRSAANCAAALTPRIARATDHASLVEPRNRGVHSWAHLMLALSVRPCRRAHPLLLRPARAHAGDLAPVRVSRQRRNSMNPVSARHPSSTPPTCGLLHVPGTPPPGTRAHYMCGETRTRPVTRPR